VESREMKTKHESTLNVRPPFDSEKLDALMDNQGVDAVLATSSHNTQYLLGGYRFFMYAWEDSVGLSRYLPVAGYIKGRTDAAFYVGAGNEDWGTDVEPLWVPQVENVAWSTVDAASKAAANIRSRVGEQPTLAVEYPYLSTDAMETLQQELPGATFVDATNLFEELRAVKSPEELNLIQAASKSVVEAMVATFEGSQAGDSKYDIAERLRREEVARGLTFAYCLIAMGQSFNRAPSNQCWKEGEVLSLDSGAERGGYVGDLARMGVLGEPTAQMKELLEEVSAVQAAARQAIRPGVRGGDIFEEALKELRACPHSAQLGFLAHGMGLVTHEAPRLTDKGSPPYPADHADRPLEAGMVISVETDLRSPDLGFVKLEDTIFVTQDGWEAPAEPGEKWNCVDV